MGTTIVCIYQGGFNRSVAGGLDFIVTATWVCHLFQMLDGSTARVVQGFEVKKELVSRLHEHQLWGYRRGKEATNTHHIRNASAGWHRHV